MGVAKAAGEVKPAKPAKAMTTARLALMERAAMSAQAVMGGEMEATAAWLMRAAQAKALEGCREGEKGLGSRLHSHCLSEIRAHSFT